MLVADSSSHLDYSRHRQGVTHFHAEVHAEIYFQHKVNLTTNPCCVLAAFVLFCYRKKQVFAGRNYEVEFQVLEISLLL